MMAHYELSYLDLHCLQKYMNWSAGMKGVNFLFFIGSAAQETEKRGGDGKETKPRIVRDTTSLCCKLATVNVLKFWTPKFLTKCYMQTVQTQIRLLLKEQSDQGLHCLPFH